MNDAKKALTISISQKSAAVFRASYLGAHRAAEVVRRVADSLREELTCAAGRNEDKQLDEAATCCGQSGESSCAA